jgi:O-antigen/teichoic acid export membrane protein
LVFFVLTLPALTLCGATTGVMQGLNRFGRLALIITIAGSGRVAGGLAGLAIGGTAITAMAGMAAGTWVAALATAAATRGPGWRAIAAGGRPPTGEIAHASTTMLALAAILTVDVLLANRYLPAADAGLYGAGNLVTMVALWAPYAVTMIALPRLAVDGRRRGTLRVSIAVLAGIGVLEVGGVLVLGPVIFPLAVGTGYRPVTGWLWLFATEGAVLAITQLVIMSRVAATDRLVPLLLWAGLIAEVVTVSFVHGTIGGILTIATVTACTVAVAGLALSLRPR